jgi:hypothetical protein
LGIEEPSKEVAATVYPFSDDGEPFDIPDDELPF